MGTAIPDASTLHRFYKPGIGDAELQFDMGTPYEVDTVQKFPIGTRLCLGDRSFYYAYASGTCTPNVLAYKAKKTNTVAVAPTQATAAAQAAAYPGETLAAGVALSRYVTVTIDTEIGVLTTGVLSANEMAGGYIVIGNNGTGGPQMRRIVSHPALTTTGGSLTMKLDAPLFASLTAASSTIEFMENPFYCLKADNAGGDYVAYIGVPTVTAASGQYFWLQTWGPCWVTSNSNTCDSALDRMIAVVGDGSVRSVTDVTVENGTQVIGYALDMSGSASSNAPFVYLMLYR